MIFWLYNEVINAFFVDLYNNRLCIFALFLTCGQKMNFNNTQKTFSFQYGDTYFFLSFSLTFLVFNGCWAFFHAAYQTLHFLKHFTFFLHYGRLFRLWKPSYDEQQQQQPTTTTTTTMLSLKQQMIVCLAFVVNGQQKCRHKTFFLTNCRLLSGGGLTVREGPMWEGQM